LRRIPMRGIADGGDGPEYAMSFCILVQQFRSPHFRTVALA
jgi:hypothetical protein